MAQAISTKLHKSLEVLIACAIFFAFFLHCRFYFLSFDIWWYLRIGKFILENQIIPHTDIYSYTAFGQPWIDHHWIAQIIYFFVYRLADFSGLFLFKGFIITLTFFVLYKALCAAAKNNYLALLICVLTFFCSMSRFFLRAETISYLFLCIFLYIIFSFKYDKKDYLWTLPLMMIIWANTHATALVGCVVMFIFVFGEYLNFKISKSYPRSHQSLLTLPEIKKLWIISIIVFVASFINANGYHLHLFLLHQGPAPLAQFPLKGVLSENVRASLSGTTYYTIFLYTCLISLVLNYRKLNITYLFMFVLGFSLSQLAVRHVEFFAILSAPLLADNLKEILKRVAEHIKQKRFLPHGSYARMIYKTLVFIAIAGLLVNHKCYRHIFDLEKVQAQRGRYPVGAVDFIEENNIDGNMFNTYRFGGYLIWKLYPQRKVFIDGRLVCYFNGVFKDYEDIFKVPVGNGAWQTIFDKYGVDYTILGYSLASTDQHLAMNLYLDKKWVLVYWDSDSLVYVKDVPKFKSIIKKYAYLMINPIDPSFAGFSNEDYKQVIQELKRKTEEDPDCFLAYDRLGIIYEKQGSLDEAADYFLKAVERAPYSAVSHFNLGLVNQKLGLRKEALQEYKLALKFNRRHLKTYIQLGLLDFTDKNYSSAIRNFKKAIKVHKDQQGIELAYLYLGASYHNLGKYKTAEIMYRKALDFKPTLKDARKNLEQLAVKGLI